MSPHLKTESNRTTVSQTSVKSPKPSHGLTKKAEPPPTRGVNRDSGTDSANGGWLRRLVRQMIKNLNHLSTYRKVSLRYPQTRLRQRSYHWLLLRSNVRFALKKRQT